MSKFINFYKTANGELIIPNKTLLRNSDINIMSNAKFKKASDFSIVNNPNMVTEYINGYIPGGVPDPTIAGAMGYATYQLFHPNEFKQSIIDIYNAITESGKMLMDTTNTDNSKIEK
ncbi:MAG: hypothetical protein J6M21_03835 [Campylobacter sp.]|nr:hypothetical protein [Campylobacter sp.]